jgi:hypothetical protein
MIIKASGRSALILAAGLFVGLASPAMAADGDDSAADAASDAPATLHKTVGHASHHRRHYAHHGHHAIAKGDDEKAAPAEAATGANKVLAEIPPSVANANAQMLLAGVQLSAAAAIPPGTDLPAAPPATANNETVVAAADQLNDSDRTLQEGSSPAPITASPAPAPTPPPPAPAATMATESSAWDQTSLIGKIFIGFGALLTAASAVRMFIA